MVIHLGAGAAVRAEAVVLMTDLTAGWAETTRALAGRLAAGRALRTLDPRPKTLVLCQEQGRETAYLSGVGLRTLSARMREDRRFFLRLRQAGGAEDAAK